MNFKGAVIQGGGRGGDFVELSGWLVDKEEGLFLLGYHCPKDYNYPDRVKIENRKWKYNLPNTCGGAKFGWWLVAIVPSGEDLWLRLGWR
ncbi:hypothetical protein [Ralstonia pseudosolanacearum]|nr:hypothetical protein [Ralstonia pseudosolanacearum]